VIISGGYSFYLNFDLRFSIVFTSSQRDGRALVSGVLTGTRDDVCGACRPRHVHPPSTRSLLPVAVGCPPLAEARPSQREGKGPQIGRYSCRERTYTEAADLTSY